MSFFSPKPNPDLWRCKECKKIGKQGTCADCRAAAERQLKYAPKRCLSCDTQVPCVCGRNWTSLHPEQYEAPEPLAELLAAAAEPAEAPDAPHLDPPRHELVQGFKADADKLRTDLLPPDVLEEVAAVLTFGANKYAPRNWEKGMTYGRVIGAAMRHLIAVMRGEDRDEETGLLHSAHAICCLMFLCGYQLRGMTQFDDRNKLGG